MYRDENTEHKFFDLMEADPSPFVMTDAEIDKMLVDMAQEDREYVAMNHILVESLYSNAPF